MKKKFGRSPLLEVGKNSGQEQNLWKKNVWTCLPTASFQKILYINISLTIAILLKTTRTPAIMSCEWLNHWICVSSSCVVLLLILCLPVGRHLLGLSFLKLTLYNDYNIIVTYYRYFFTISICLSNLLQTLPIYSLLNFLCSMTAVNYLQKLTDEWFTMNNTLNQCLLACSLLPSLCWCIAAYLVKNHL